MLHLRPMRQLFALFLVTTLSAFVHAEETKIKGRPPFDVPPRYGFITEYDPGKKPHPTQIIVMIQDLHANVGVQKNIAAILYRLNRINLNTMGVLVCVEGASGEGDVSLLRSLPYPVRKAFEDLLLRKAYLTGAELSATESAAEWTQQQAVWRQKLKSFFGLANEVVPVTLSPIRLWGVDDPELYRMNWRAAKFVDRNARPAMDELRHIRGIIGEGAAKPLLTQLDLTSKLIRLSLQPEEYRAYLKSRSLNPSGSKLFNETVKAAETYYEMADKRSYAMADNLLKKTGATPGYTALITGGFHTNEISAELARRGIAYAVVQPQVRVLDQDAAYKARLREEE